MVTSLSMPLGILKLDLVSYDNPKDDKLQLQIC